MFYDIKGVAGIFLVIEGGGEYFAMAKGFFIFVMSFLELLLSVFHWAEGLLKTTSLPMV